MKVKELIEELKKYNLEKEVMVFVKGKNFPVYEVQDLTEKFKIDKIEIGCGWEEIEDEENMAYDTEGNCMGKVFPL